MVVFSTSKLSSAWSQRDELQARIIGFRSQGLLLLPGRSTSAPLEASHIPTVGKNGAVEAHGQPEAREIHESSHKYIQNAVVSSTPVMLSGGLREPSKSLQEFCSSPILRKAMF